MADEITFDSDVSDLGKKYSNQAPVFDPEIATIGGKYAAPVPVVETVPAYVPTTDDPQTRSMIGGGEGNGFDLTQPGGMLSRAGNAAIRTLQGPYGMNPLESGTDHPALRWAYNNLMQPASAAVDWVSRPVRSIVPILSGAGAGLAQDLGVSPAYANRIERDLNIAPYGATGVAFEARGPTPMQARINAVAYKAHAEAAGETTGAGASQASRPTAPVAEGSGVASEAPPNSVGAMGTPGNLSSMTPDEMRANRAMAERQWLTTQGTPAPYVERVPNVQPSMATQEQSANLAREEKKLESFIPQPWKDASAANGEARQQHFQDIAGSAPQVESARANAKADYNGGIAKSFSPDNQKPINPDSVVALHNDMVNNVLNHPQNIDNPTLQQYLGPLVDKLVDKDGNAAILDPQRLYGIRQQAGRLMTKASSGIGGDSNLQHITGELNAFQDALTPVIEEGAPGITKTISDYADAQKVPNIQEALQNYETGKNGARSIYDPQGRMTYSGVHTMLGDVIEGRANADPLNPYKHMPEEDFQALQALHDSLKAVATAKELARAQGSDTVQNAYDVAKDIAKQSIVGAALKKVPMAGPILDAVTSARSQNRMARRSQEMLNPPRNPLAPEDDGPGSGFNEAPAPKSAGAAATPTELMSDYVPSTDLAAYHEQTRALNNSDDMTPRLTPAMRIGNDTLTGPTHGAIERQYQLGHDATDKEFNQWPNDTGTLGFVNPAGRFLTRQQAFQYALDNDLIDPARQTEAQRFKDAMEQSGNTKNLFLPSEWLKKPETAPQPAPSWIDAYHGTGAPVSTLDIGRPTGAGSREGPIGIWTTNHPGAASQFADFAARGQGANVMPVRVNLQNPLVVKNYDQIRDLIDKHTTFAKPDYEVAGRQVRMVQDKVDYQGLRDELKKRGFDGIVLKNTLMDSPDGKTPIDQYVAFSPDQVRSRFAQPMPQAPANPLQSSQ